MTTCEETWFFGTLLLTLYCPVFTLCIIRLNVQKFYVLPTQCYFCVFCGSRRTNSDPSLCGLGWLVFATTVANARYSVDLNIWMWFRLIFVLKEWSCRGSGNYRPLLLPKPGFEITPVGVKFVVDRVALRQISVLVFRLSPFSGETSAFCSVINSIRTIAQSNTTFYEVITIKRQLIYF
jgi:hypothetical protein